MQKVLMVTQKQNLSQHDSNQMHLKNKMVDPSLSPLSNFPVGDLHKSASFLFFCLSNGSFLEFCNYKDMLLIIIPMSGHIPSDAHLLVEFVEPFYETNS
jgi:hypothetical protein